MQKFLRKIFAWLTGRAYYITVVSDVDYTTIWVCYDKEEGAYFVDQKTVFRWRGTFLEEFVNVDYVDQEIKTLAKKYAISSDRISYE